MSEVLAASGTLGKLNLDGGKRQARADLFGFMQTLLAIDQTVEPAMHARTLDEREGPAAATAAARSDRAAADAADTALCQRLMGHLIVATVGEARTIVTTAMDGREALAALIEFVDGDASTPDGSDAIIADTSEISWNTFPNGLGLSKFTYDILARLAYAAGESATAYAQTPYNAGDPLYQSLVRGLVKAIGPDHAPHTFNAVHSALAVELHKPESTLSYQEAMHAIRAQARSIGRDRPASLSTMTVVQAETNSLGLGDRPATLQMTRRADDARARKFEKVWCDRCAGWGHRGMYCDLPDDEVVCLLCREVGHDLSKCRKKGPLGYRSWNPNGGDAMPTILHRAGSPERTEFDRRREREVLRRAGRQRYATSVRQTAVALSTCEAETSAHALATRVAIPIRLTLAALRCYRLPRPVAIHCDNTAVLALIKRRHVNSRLRHYRVNIAFVFHAIELGLTTVRYCKTTHMRADFLTKALPVGAFRANAALVYPDYEYAPL